MISNCSSLNLKSFLEIADGLATIIGVTSDILGLIDDDQQASQINTQNLLVKITKQIDLGNELLYKRIKFDNKVSDIEEAEREIKHALDTLKYLIQSNSTERPAYIEDFLKSSEDAIEYANNLPNLIIRSVPGTTNDFLQQFSENCRCNMTLIDEFQYYYRNMTGNGMMVEIIAKHLKHIKSLTNERVSWEKKFATIDSAFANQKNDCKKQFKKMLQDDIINAENASSLFSNIQQRYNWVLNDVVFAEQVFPGKIFGACESIFKKVGFNFVEFQDVTEVVK